ncbi:hypothetical protein ADIMK_4005 [Marinobacterium lacunae]|uniref:Uncharacterized protein n=1 Tax=Marinobacterium lacunae TaxID=1232683 RepID=A0A081FTK3_9GAMM|nr:hypothetical protein ADIMK_4005 [Marinobacterium lacunae]
MRFALKSHHLLRRSNVGCTAGYSLHGHDYLIPNMTLAPGFVAPNLDAAQSENTRDTA